MTSKLLITSVLVLSLSLNSVLTVCLSMSLASNTQQADQASSVPVLIDQEADGEQAYQTWRKPDGSLMQILTHDGGRVTMKLYEVTATQPPESLEKAAKEAGYKHVHDNIFTRHANKLGL